MAKPTCECGHEKRDHRAALMGTGAPCGECKVCLCREYSKSTLVAEAAPAVAVS